MLATLANAAWFASAWPDERRFRDALDEPRHVQESILREYVRRNIDTDFGRRFRFADIASTDDFRRRVPIHDYDALAPDIDRVAAGESRVLTAEPVRRLATSSGSTRARKLIPYTAGLQREFNRAIGPWIVDLYRGDPQLARGCAYWSITPIEHSEQARRTRPPGAPPIGFEEDAAYLGGVRKRLVDAVMAVPGDMRRITNVDAFRRATLEHLIRRRDLRLISVWHPSFLELLLDAGEPRDWREIWPNLRVISCWADAHAAGPASALAKRLSWVRFQPKGLLATEAFVTIPYAGAWPLAVRSHFFEFIEIDHDNNTPRTLLADELKPGGEYAVVVTTAGGLWRYRLGDRVHVEGFVGRTPSLRFAGRADHVVDRFGEKLSEGFVGQILREVVGSVAFAMLAPVGDAYTLFIESGELPGDAAERLDRALRANPHYAWCRELGQLKPPGVFQIRGNAYAAYAGALVSRGQRLGDIKPCALSDYTDWPNIFAGEWIRT